MKPWVSTDKNNMSSDEERHNSASIGFFEGSAAPKGAQ